MQVSSDHSSNVKVINLYLTLVLFFSENYPPAEHINRSPVRSPLRGNGNKSPSRTGPARSRSPVRPVRSSSAGQLQKHVGRGMSAQFGRSLLGSRDDPPLHGHPGLDSTAAARGSDSHNMLIYNSQFSGLESYGASGMTILDEVPCSIEVNATIFVSLRSCLYLLAN